MSGKNNALVEVGGGLCGMLLIVILYMTFHFHMQWQEQEGFHQENMQQLKELKRWNPAPSKNNVDQLKRNISELSNSVAELSDLFEHKSSSDEARVIEPTVNTKQRFKVMREKIATAGIELDDSFDSSFKRYAELGLPPIPTHLNRLSRQLVSAERLVDILVDCRVHKINQVAREVFEDVSAEERDDYTLIGSFVGPRNIFVAERMQVDFVANEQTVWNVLKSMMTNSHAMAVSTFSFHAQKDLMQYSPENNKLVSDEQMKAFLSGKPLIGKGAVPQSERMFTGNDLLNISLVVDVYHFKWSSL